MFKRRRFVYFVAYSGSGRVGRCEVTMPYKLKFIEDVEAMETTLRGMHSLDFVSVTNYQLLRRVK